MTFQYSNNIHTSATQISFFFVHPRNFVVFFFFCSFRRARHTKREKFSIHHTILVNLFNECTIRADCDTVRRNRSRYPFCASTQTPENRHHPMFENHYPCVNDDFRTQFFPKESRKHSAVSFSFWLSTLSGRLGRKIFF